MEIIEGFLDDIVFQSEDDMYCVLRLRGKGVGRFTAVYRGPSPNVGMGLRLTGSWGEHPKFGKQFAVANLEITELVKPKRRKRRQNVAASPELVDFLETHGLSAAYAERIEKVYQDTSIKQIENNPYILVKDVKGIGFKLADRLAMYLGVERNDARRIEAGICYELTEMGKQGHVCMPEGELIERTAKILGCQKISVAEKYQELVQEDLLRTENSNGICYVYSEEFYEAEVETARLLKFLRDGAKRLAKVDADAVIGDWEKEAKITLAKEQKDAIYASLEHGVLVLTGGPGTGKTTVVKGIMNVLTKAGCSIFLAAPTGRAARRLAESAGQTAKTVHRLLEYRPSDGNFANYVFGKNEEKGKWELMSINMKRLSKWSV